MRVASVDGLMTLFYDGSESILDEELHNEGVDIYMQDDLDGEELVPWGLSNACKKYWKSRLSWEQVIVVEGVTKIPDFTFWYCKNIKRVVCANTVLRIEQYAFHKCKSLLIIKLSINIQYIGKHVFEECNLQSVFVPSTCTDVDIHAFRHNRRLIICNVAQQTRMHGKHIFDGTKLLKKSPYNIREIDTDGPEPRTDEPFNDWVKNINSDDEFSLHRACCDNEPTVEIFLPILETQGIGAFLKKNKIGITPSRYLKKNPFAKIKEIEIVRNYIMNMVGECE
ncbi:hypothetical protein CTEN210_05506 [Chaetoceros tenuissimus]|uniref:Uncharacterized protein n=1 Tax=Chaetoceros tenuissimus TaxID=426638 RepID=A0AAD3CPZ5_9STRA|nr:hypothetical protein CTEN210_05506 [Chaetoceros tenuissimus]